MAYNICINCGTNLNFLIKDYISQQLYFENEINKIPNISDEKKNEYKKYYNNLFFIKYNIDRLCCRQFFISYIDYCPSIF